MTARDDAIAYAASGANAPEYLAAEMVDAIPGDVLVRLAVDRGVLIDAGITFMDGDYKGPIYRLVTP